MEFLLQLLTVPPTRNDDVDNDRYDRYDDDDDRIDPLTFLSVPRFR